MAQKQMQKDRNFDLFWGKCRDEGFVALKLITKRHKWG
jgi:hypothetical protein